MKPSIDNPDVQVSNSDYQRRFGGIARLFGADGARRIAVAHVAVVGVGGVGSWCAEALARSGVGRITLVDLDNVSESNINRQIQALTNTIGMPKVDAMRLRIHAINPDCHVQVVEDFVDPANASALLGGSSDLTAVIDACDQVRAKAAMAHVCLQQERLFITVGAAGGRMRPECMELDDLGRVTHDPLLAQVRYQLRRQYGVSRKPGQSMKIPCVFSREPVVRSQNHCEAPQSDNTLNCAGYGSSVAVTASFGMAAAGWVIKKIAKISEK